MNNTEIWTFPSTGVEQFLATYGLLAIFVVMLLKELGVPVPVPSDLIVITAGVQAAAGRFHVLELLLVVLIATVVGSSVQFLIARNAGRAFVYRIGRWVGLTAERLDRAGAMLRSRGALAVFLGLNVPIARSGIIPAAGLAGLPLRSFLPAMASGSLVFYGWHLALGYFAGPTALALLERLNLPILPVILALALLGLAGWLVLRRRREVRTAPGDKTLGQLRSWTEAACPVCLVATAIHRPWPAESGTVPDHPSRQRTQPLESASDRQLLP